MGLHEFSRRFCWPWRTTASKISQQVSPITRQVENHVARGKFRFHNFDDLRLRMGMFPFCGLKLLRFEVREFA